MSYYNDLNLLELDDLRECLNYIDASDRDTWLYVCWGLSKSYNAREDVKQIFKAWARTSSIRDENKDSKHEDKEWLKALTNSKYTLGTVIKLACQSGYKLPKSKQTNNSNKNININISDTVIKSSIKNTLKNDSDVISNEKKILNDVQKLSKMILSTLLFFTTDEQLTNIFVKYDSFKSAFIIDYDHIIFDALLTFKQVYTSEYNINNFTNYCKPLLKAKNLLDENTTSENFLHEHYFNNDLLPLSNYELENAFLYLQEKSNLYSIICNAKAIQEKAIQKALYDFDLGYFLEKEEDVYLKQLASNLQSSLHKIKPFEEVRSNNEDFFTSLEQSFIDLQDPKNIENTFFKTGFSGIDEAIIGLKRGDVSMLVAHTGIGKTFITEQIQLHMCKQGYKTLFISNEMDTNELKERVCFINNKITREEIIDKKKYVNVKNEVNKLEKTIKINNGTFDIVYQKDLNEKDIENHIKRVRYTHGLDFVVIDYLQKIDYSEKTKNMPTYEAIKNVMGYITSCAKTHNVSILVATQFGKPETKLVKSKDNNNNSNYLKKTHVKPELENIAGATDAAKDADNVFLLYKTGDNLFELEISKNRHSSSHNIINLTRTNGGGFQETGLTYFVESNNNKGINNSNVLISCKDENIYNIDTTTKSKRVQKKEKYDPTVIIAKDDVEEI